MLIKTNLSFFGQANVHVVSANQISNILKFSFISPPILVISIQFIGFGIIFVCWSLFSLNSSLKNSYNIILNFDSFLLLNKLLIEFQNNESVFKLKSS